MRRFALLCSAAVLAACTKTDKTPAADTAAAPAAALPAAAPAATPAPLSLKDVAGTWAMTGKYEGTDSTVVTYDLTATADSTGWKIKFPDRARTEPVRIISVGGDSIVGKSGPYSSAIFKGVKVTTDNVYRLRDGKLTNRTIAHYSRTGPDSMRIIMAEGTRK